MPEWEYAIKKVTHLNIQGVLREYGKCGWELVQVLEKDVTPMLIFKRTLKED